MRKCTSQWCLYGETCGQGQTTLHPYSLLSFVLCECHAAPRTTIMASRHTSSMDRVAQNPSPWGPCSQQHVGAGCKYSEESPPSREHRFPLRSRTPAMGFREHMVACSLRGQQLCALLQKPQTGDTPLPPLLTRVKASASVRWKVRPYSVIS